MKNFIKGISVCNPVDVDEEYLLYTVDYAEKNGFNHLQIIGPIHNHVKGNIDGMTFYNKYSQFNNEKDADYVNHSLKAINKALALAKKANIKTYMWHHELYLPSGFKDAYPEILNNYGDIEVSHPKVQDFLENKIRDFFSAYPDMDGIILTLHETQIPLLKLKNQKLDKTERVKHVTKILYDTCMSLGKELIVRPFASIEEDYINMTKAYEEISKDLIIMDKWTQFDWSLTMPSNRFYSKIKNNPLFVEADIFGEFFGKGRLPLMLKKHIAEKFEYCGGFNPTGYVARIDRAGQIPFGDVNEVNLHIMSAHLNGQNPDDAIKSFYMEKYPDAFSEVMSIMSETEDVLRKIIYLDGYYFSELSRFPSLNHSKNHYYLEMMRTNYAFRRDEWYIPRNWERKSRDYLISEKQEAEKASENLFDRIVALKEKIADGEYEKLYTKFLNLKLVAKIWRLLLETFIAYVSDLDEGSVSFDDKLCALCDAASEGKQLLGDKFYCLCGDYSAFDFIGDFVADIRKSFELEKTTLDALSAKNNIDYVVCGGALEGHLLSKEVNFSDTLILDDALCRIPGNKRGLKWSAINAHGWFSYTLKIKPDAKNLVKILLGSVTDTLDVRITIGNEACDIHEKIADKTEITLPYTAGKDENAVEIRFDKISAHMPCIFTIETTEDK